MNAIISALQDGPKRYNELRSLMCWQLLDIQLDRLCRTREVVLSHDRFGRGQFQLPKPPDPDERLVPSRKVLGLSKPRKNQYCFDKGGRKKCPSCKRRRGRSAYLYGGKAWGNCYECRDKGEAKCQ